MSKTRFVFLFLITLFLTGSLFALNLSSTREQVRKTLGEPQKIEIKKKGGLEVWKYPKGEVIFRKDKICGFDQTETKLFFDLGKREKKAYLKYLMKIDQVPKALGTPARIEPDPMDTDFFLWHYKDPPAPDGGMGCVAIYKERVLGWSLGDKKNFYACHIWDPKKDEPETPVQKRVLKKVGEPSAQITVAKKGKRQKTVYIFHMEKSGIYKMEFRHDLEEGFRVLNPQENPTLLEKLSSIHPPKSSRMTDRKVYTLNRKQDKQIREKPAWKRIRQCKKCR